MPCSYPSIKSSTDLKSLNSIISKISKDVCYLMSSAGGTGVTSVTGTTDRVTSSGGATPAIDIADTYVGQSSITTLGTINTGTWNGTTIGVAYGGTGKTSIAANKILYSSSANTYSETIYKENAEADYLGTPVWDGTPPSNLLNGKFAWYQIGTQVTLRIRLSYNSAGTTNTSVTLPLPAGMPTPVKPTGFSAANTSMYWGTGGLATANTGFIANSAKVVLGNDSAGTGYEVRVSSASLAAKIVNITITYTASN